MDGPEPLTKARGAEDGEPVGDIRGPEAQGARLREVAWLFLRLGATTFGGPLVHIAMMERESVRRKWVTREQFLDLVGITNLLPGPSSTEMAMHLGHARAGGWGLVVGGACFILPAALITVAFAWAYVAFGKLPETTAILYGTKPVIVAVVAHALWGLGKTALKRRSIMVLAVGSAIACALGAHELLVLALAGLAAAAIGAPPRAKEKSVKEKSAQSNAAMGAQVGAGVIASGALAAGAAPFGLAPLFFTFVKIGSILFGSGYVLLAFLRADLVERLHWMTEGQLLDAVTIGQITPGPLFTTATFIGFVLGGGAGAAVATLGIFLPAFVFVAASGPIVRRIRASARAGAFLDGVNAASLALMAVVAARIAKAAIVDPVTVGLTVVSLAVLLRFRPNATWLIGGGAAIGLLARAAGVHM